MFSSTVYDTTLDRLLVFDSTTLPSVPLLLFRLVSSPEYRLCGRSLRTAMPSAFFCPISTSSRWMLCKKPMICSLEGGISAVAISRKARALRVVLEIYQTIAVVQLQLKQPEHCKSQKTGNLRPGVAAHGGVVERDDALVRLTIMPET